MKRRDARIAVAVAVFAGTALRLCRRPLRNALRAAPGLAGAAGIAVGLGEVAGHVWQRGLTWWVALVIAGGFVLWFAAEMNSKPRVLRDVSSEE